MNGHTFTPKRTRDWEATVALAARATMKGSEPLDKTLRVELTFGGARKNADIDNLAKSVLDAGNKILWYDDHQIVDLHIKRTTSMTGVLIKIWEHEQEV